MRRPALPLPCHSLVLAILMIAALAGCSTNPPAQRNAPGGRTARTLSGTPDQLAESALKTLVADRDNVDALKLIERATEQAPNRPELVWLHVRICIETRGCEPEPIEERLRKLDPDTGLVWLGVLARAQARKDQRAEEQIVEAMSRAQRFDVYWTSLIWRLAIARQTNAAGVAPKGSSTVPITPLTTALNELTEWLSAIALDAFKPLDSVCTAAAVSDPTVAARCERIAQALQRSDTVLAEGIGLGIAQRLSAPGSEAAQRIEERIATLGYQAQAAGVIMRSQVEHEKFSAQLVELMKKLHREQEVTIAILRWAGEPLAP